MIPEKISHCHVLKQDGLRDATGCMVDLVSVISRYKAEKYDPRQKCAGQILCKYYRCPAFA